MQSLWQFGYRLRNGFRHADGKVSLGRDGLGRCNNTVAPGFNDGGVGVGATGVHSDQVGS